MSNTAPAQEDPQQPVPNPQRDAKSFSTKRDDEWTPIEDTMQRHDEGTMDGHLKDIDTLLVFAGLFSAVLTAFVVESYQQLQLDTGTGSMLVHRRISVQLESFTLSPAGVANSSASAPPLPSLDFVADSATRWINALWFLSLIFSLASALFGIMVKQWIREYMQWNSALAPPRDNVLVRQIRFEAWNSWNVPATIASIPALLEISLVFFVCGLVILLWTLDPVVSTVVTTAAAVFLAIASTFTFLPAFFRRCPYKSPTAWAVAIVWDVVVLWIPHSISRLQHWLGGAVYTSLNYGLAKSCGKWLMKNSDHGRWMLKNRPAIPRSWRDRDLASVWSSFAPSTGMKRGDVTPFMRALHSEQFCVNCVHPCTSRSSTFLEAAACLDWRAVISVRSRMHDARRTVTELPPLVRALAWVSQASPDAHTQTSVSRCVEALDCRFVLAEPTPDVGFTQEAVRTVSIRHLLDLFIHNGDLKKAFDGPDEGPASTVCGHGRSDTWSPRLDSLFVDLLEPGAGSELAVSIAVRLCALLLCRTVRQLLTTRSGSWTDARRVMELLVMLNRIGTPQIDANVELAVQCLRTCVVDMEVPSECNFEVLRNHISRATREVGEGMTSDLFFQFLPQILGSLCELRDTMRNVFPSSGQSQWEATTSHAGIIHPPLPSNPAIASSSLGVVPVHVATVGPTESASGAPNGGAPPDTSGDLVGVGDGDEPSYDPPRTVRDDGHDDSHQSSAASSNPTRSPESCSDPPPAISLHSSFPISDPRTSKPLPDVPTAVNTSDHYQGLLDDAEEHIPSDTSHHIASCSSVVPLPAPHPPYHNQLPPPASPNQPLMHITVDESPVTRDRLRRWTGQ